MNASRSLTERVRDRVAEVGIDLERRDGAAGRKSRKAGRPSRLTMPASRSHQNSDEQRENRSLRRVYGELKSTYQQYRRRTGRPSVPALREAVEAFKRGPSLTSLVGVAIFLDDRGLLVW